MLATELLPGVALGLFERHVKQALRLFDDPQRLGQESPLASLYMLGRALRDAPQPLTERIRGDSLRAEIRAAAARLWRGPLPASPAAMLAAIMEVRRNPDDTRYAYVVLELRCFNEFVTPNRTSDIWEEPHLLPGSKSQHYRDFDAAVKSVAALLLDSLRPTVRAERPRPPTTLYGYERQLAALVAALADNNTVTIGGPGGVGKSSIAATALAALPARPAFWYTMRPGFNDGASSLLFALGAFLHEHGAPNLWQYLVVTGGAPADLSLAAGLLRQDLAGLAGGAPILCFDDMEHLTTGGLGLVAPIHAQLLDLIESLRGVAPLLLISQRPLAAGDLHLELSGLKLGEVELLLRDAGRADLPGEAERLHAYTGGNPRLLGLMLTLDHDATAELEATGPVATPSLLPAFQRLWRRLTPQERRGLQRLAVFQGYAPEELLDPTVRESAARLRLIEHDGVGGVAVLPALAPFIDADLTPELRETLHAEAALVRLERGEYTAAAFHFVASKQEQLALQAWFPQRRQAIARGEADAARRVFGAISRQRLEPAERKALDTIRAELRQLAGQHDEALHELEQLDWSEESEAQARLWMLRGELEDALGYADRAVDSYGEGLRVSSRLLGRLAALHQRRGLLYTRRHQHAAAWEEIYRGEFDLQVLRGMLHVEEGDYPAALEEFQRALALADRLDDDTLRAQAERFLAMHYGRLQKLDCAITHAARATAIFERLGDRPSLEKMRGNLAFIYVQTRRFEAAIEAGTPAYAFFRHVGDPYFAAAAAANLAEASFELGDMERAAHYAGEVIALGDRHAAPYARFTLGQIALARQSAEAVEQLGESMRLAHANDDSYMVAYAQRALGQAMHSGGDHGGAREQLAGALALFTQLGIPGEITATERLIGSLFGA